MILSYADLLCGHSTYSLLKGYSFVPGAVITATLGTVMPPNCD